MPRHRSAVLVLALACAGCTTVRHTSPKEIPYGTDFEVRAADPVHVTGTNVTLTVVSIADSRCPSDVTCVTAGDAVVALVLSGDGDRADTLHTSGLRRRETTYGGHRIELTDVRPYPVSTARDRVPTAVLRVSRPR
jgi:hypothetical protein